MSFLTSTDISEREAAVMPSDPGSFSTLSCLPGERADSWRLALGRVFPGKAAVAANKLRASLSSWMLDDIILAKLVSNRQIIERWKAGRGCPEPDRCIVFYIQLRGSGVASQSGRNGVLAAGDAIFFHSDAPYSLAMSDKSELLALEVQHTRLKSGWDWLGANSAIVISGKAPGVQMLRDFLGSIWRQGPSVIDETPYRESLAETLLALIGNTLCVKARWFRSNEAGPLSTHERILQIIERDLFLPELRPAALAVEIGVSTRSIQQVFAKMGTTATEYILNQRLDIAAKELEMAVEDRSITVIAMSLGFSDPSYFSRCFKERTGLTPREFRNRNRTPEGR